MIFVTDPIRRPLSKGEFDEKIRRRLKHKFGKGKYQMKNPMIITCHKPVLNRGLKIWRASDDENVK